MGRNNRLAEAISRAGLRNHHVAGECQVDPKTVERWVYQGRVPHPRHRDRLVQLFGMSEEELWPAARLGSPESRALPVHQYRLYPYRASIPADLWVRLLDDTRETFDMLVYAGMFFHELQPRLVELLREKADTGVQVRLLFGDPDADAVALRGSEEGIGEAVAAKVRNALAHYRPLDGHPGIDVRLHGTTLYASIYRFDDEMLVNTHVYGLPAAHCPTLRLRRDAAADLFDTYAASFERVWATAAPAWPAQQVA